jgi:microcin C transport system substrate-binding protein
VKEEIRHTNPAGMQAFVFNTRRTLFSDARVRKALNYAFDFEWTNHNLFHGAYIRSNSYFSNSELGAAGLPSDAELALLKPHKELLPIDAFSREYQSPVSDASGNIRQHLRQATALLREAGWQIENKRLVRSTDTLPFEFEILLVSKDFERIVLPFTKNLERLGIKASIRLVDQSEYINRIREFSFDMIISTFSQSDSPGNEQRDYWFSEFADRKGSRNLIGVKDPVVDKLIEHIINADDRTALITACRALDRVLLWGHYVIPQWHINSYRIAYSSKLMKPKIQPDHDIGLFNWWINSAE